MTTGVDIERGLRSTAQLLKHALTEANATVEIDVEDELPRIVGDSGGLRCSHWMA